MADFALTRSYFYPRLTPMYHPFFYEPGPSLLTTSFFDIDDAISRMHDTAARQMVEVFKDFDPLIPQAARRRRSDWMDVDDDEFFKDIEPPFSKEEGAEGKQGEKEKMAAAEPEPAPGEEAQQGQQREAQAQQPEAQKGQQQQQQQQQQQREPRTLSTRYVYSSTTVRGDKGEPIVREFKHYEDSTGRAKTFRRRAIGDKSIPEVYQKFPDQDKVERKVLGNMKENDVQDFEKKWQETPFGKLTQEEIEGGKGQEKQQQLEGHKESQQVHSQRTEKEREK